MNNVTLSLELPYKLAAEVLAFLNSRSESRSLPPAANITPDDKEPIMTLTKPQASPAVTKPTAGKTVKMPTFGRTQTDIDSYEDSEESRMEEKDEKAFIRAEKLREKEEVTAVAQAEVDTILTETKTTEPPSGMPPPFWEL